MKVYELMAALNEMPAGADVEISTLITKEEYLNGRKHDDDMTAIRFGICELSYSHNDKIFIETEVLI